MAIVFEDVRRDRVGFPAFLGWFAILAVFAVAVYYVFFRRPDILPLYEPEGLQNTQAISALNLDPQSVVNDPKFQRLIPHVGAPSLPNIGRQNPFLAF